ncbi:MAG: energy-coupling factor transporter transmembrane protein EcfT [Oscillospiraceae bacterium]|jgi:energy-coupling factor transport system permease protein|nr:energy-coupling factor transporter transmembrane protein EcfT [Oscillospiraceae bacterium]
MLRDVTIGQYFPGGTPIHRLDPRTKLVWTVIFITALFMARGALSYALMLCVLAGCVFASRVSARALMGSIKPMLIIICITAILNVFFTRGEVIARLWVISVTREGLISAAYMASRLVMLISGTFLLTYTTSPIALTDGIESLLGPLKKIRLPVHELAMMMSIALRFIPTLIEETDKIMSAQKARGADFETGGLIKRAKALLPILIPLFISAFRRADELAVAMESRCYHGGEGRTRMKKLRMTSRDCAALALGAALPALIVVTNMLSGA